MVLGDGSWSSWKPWARNLFKASAAVKRLYDSNVRKVGFTGYAFGPTPTGLVLPQDAFLPTTCLRSKPLALLLQMTPVRCSFNPNWTVSRPQPNTVAARRALPRQYFNIIAAWKIRRSAPDIFELANKSNREGSAVDRKVALGG
jgi:hypothetical protein